MPLADTTAVLREIDELLMRAGLHPGDAVELDDFESFGISMKQNLFASFDSSMQWSLFTSWSAAIERFAAPKSAYIDQARLIAKQGWPGGTKLTRLHGVLIALRADYEAGYLRSIEELIHADLFADFLEMADELQKKKFKDPAAVIAGSVLEEHLRKLAGRHGVTVLTAGRPKKAGTLNADLVKATIYNKLEQKNVTAWLGLRNDAAHGHFDNYDGVQVGLLIQSVRAFLTRYPA